MKKTMLLIAAASIMAAALSCQKEQAVEKESNIASKEILTVSADIAQFASAATRTSIKGSATTPQPVWSAGDEIKLFNTEGGSAIYTISNGAGASSAIFTPKSGSGLSGTFACAYYPAENATSYTEGTGITATIPATQAYTAAVSGDTGTNAGTFAVGSFPMVGTGTIDESKGNLNLTFKNVFGLLQLNFTGSETIKQIDVIGSANLSGTATITATSTPSCTISSGVKYVTLTTTESMRPTLSGASTAFYIAVPAGTNNISKIAVTTTDGSYNKSTTQTIARSEILSLNAITLLNMSSGAIYPEAPDLSPVTIGNVTWAPVNCGYSSTYTCGLLYQWGRKDGCGYNDGSTYTETLIQALYTENAQVDGSTVTENAGYFYWGSSLARYDWLATKDNSRWNSGSESSPSKTSNDPCPTGWRVPTRDELGSLCYTDWNSSSHSGSTKRGSWDFTAKGWDFGGVFLPAAGNRNGSDGSAYDRGSYGYYWSSSVNGDYARYLFFNKSNNANVDHNRRAYGDSVRCVQE